jgi:hypothetical protein
LGELEEVRRHSQEGLADAFRKAMKAKDVTPAEIARRMDLAGRPCIGCSIPRSAAQRWIPSDAHRLR